jgi:hypothetical protein
MVEKMPQTGDFLSEIKDQSLFSSKKITMAQENLYFETLQLIAGILSIFKNKSR